MKLLNLRFPLFIFTAFFLVACSPHPGTGVWKSVADNEQGIEKLTVGFEGKAEFTSKKLNNALWHCFWTTSGERELSLQCTASTNIEQKILFTVTVDDQGLAQLHEGAAGSKGSKRLATFVRLDENPSPRK